MEFIERNLSQSLLAAAKHFPALVLVGPRQSGKTTLLRHLFPDHAYVTLDRPLLAEQADQDPEQFLAQYPAPVLIDEVQYAPGLFRYLKIKIDENRQAKGLYILTGSQKFTLMKGVSESLAGRAAILDFEGLSGLELLASKKIEPDTQGINQMLVRGGFPELWQDVSRPIELYLDSYIATYLERDVKQVLAVGNLRDFERFLRACALRSAQQLNKSDLARDVGISVTTAGEWLSVLQALGQVYLLEPWFGNVTKRLVKSPKLYLAEPALMGHLCGIRQDTLTQSPFVGAFWETLVYAELRKQLAFRGLKPRLWYYRDQSQNEADFILENGHQLTLYECKWTCSPTRAMASNLDRIQKIFSESSSTFQVTQKKLVTRAAEHFSSDGLTFTSIFQGLLEKAADAE